MKISVFTVPFCVAALSAAVAGTVRAQAQDDSAADARGSSMFLEEILVTARKREENVQEIPVAINLVSGDDAEALGISDLRELSTLLTSLTFDRGANQGDFRPAIRGLQAERGRTSVGLLIDGIDVTSEALQSAGGGFLANQRLLDVERIEVVKGPQAALYGRSAFGGAVNWITRRPDLEAVDGRAFLEGNSEEGYEFRGAIGTPINDKLAVRANGFVWDERGYYKNQRSGDYVGGGDGYGLALGVLATPTDSVTLYANLSHSDETYDPRDIVLNTGNTVVTFSPEVAEVLGRGPTQTIYVGKVQPGDVQYDLDPDTGRDFPGTTSENTRAAFIAEFDLGSVQLTSLSSWIQAKYWTQEDSDYRASFQTDDSFAQGAATQSNRGNTIDQYSQGLRLQSNTDGPLRWTVGADYWKETVDQNDRFVATLPLGPITLADYNEFYGNRVPLLPFREFSRDTEHFSVFGFIEYDFTDKLSVSLEGRQSSETITYALDHAPDGRDGFPFFQGLIPTDVPGQPISLPLAFIRGADSVEVDEDYFTPRIAMSYAYSDTVNYYASAAKAIKPAGHATGSAILFDEETAYDRETLYSYEVGAKTTWMDGRLTLNTALFFQDYSDQQVNSQVFSEELGTLRGRIENAGETEILGFEVDAVYLPTENLRLTLGYTYLDAEFTDFTVLSSSASRVAESGCNIVVISGRATCEIDRAGNVPADLPEHRVVGQAHYRDTLVDDWDWFALGIFSYTDERFAETANVQTQSALRQIDMQLGVENSTWRIAAFVENLTDEDDITDGSPFVDYGNGFAPNAFGYLRAPRLYGVRINAQF